MITAAPLYKPLWPALVHPNERRRADCKRLRNGDELRRASLPEHQVRSHLEERLSPPGEQYNVFDRQGKSSDHSLCALAGLEVLSHKRFSIMDYQRKSVSRAGR
jgi:hypothetical protein